MRKMPAMAAMLRIRFLSATGEGLQARRRIEFYIASRLNGVKIFGRRSVSGKGVIRPSGAARLRERQDFFRAPSVGHNRQGDKADHIAG